MKDKKLQVFVSSTFIDMKEERQAAVEAILSSGNIPAGMELFAAGDESQMTVIKRWIDESDVYLLILGGRYGSIEKNTGKSYTHLEYEYALSLNKPLFAIVINKNALEKKVKEKGTDVIEQENAKELNAFKDLVLQNLVKFYDDKKDIKIAIHETLSDFTYSKKELIGWIRGNNSVNAAQLAEEIARLTKENSELRSQVLNNSNVLYANLTFEELKMLLEKSLPSNGINDNMFEFIIEFGNEFVRGITFQKLVDRIFYQKLVNMTLTLLSDKIDEIIYQLITFKILSKDSNNKEIFFTEDGHNFYLKVLSLEK